MPPVSCRSPAEKEIGPDLFRVSSFHQATRRAKLQGGRERRKKENEGERSSHGSNFLPLFLKHPPSQKRALSFLWQRGGRWWWGNQSRLSPGPERARKRQGNSSVPGWLLLLSLWPQQTKQIPASAFAREFLRSKNQPHRLRLPLHTRGKEAVQPLSPTPRQEPRSTSRSGLAPSLSTTRAPPVGARLLPPLGAEARRDGARLNLPERPERTLAKPQRGSRPAEDPEHAPPPAIFPFFAAFFFLPLRSTPSFIRLILREGKAASRAPRGVQGAKGPRKAAKTGERPGGPHCHQCIEVRREGVNGVGRREETEPFLATLSWKKSQGDERGNTPLPGETLRKEEQQGTRAIGKRWAHARVRKQQNQRGKAASESSDRPRNPDVAPKGQEPSAQDGACELL
ncbi:uncharacterized protein [Erythrolamprus reginae]|uniref:uncharacterized protein n=1 Tax=Erythrolamprus reginae TaxID=121349 RepID=UPI00396CFC9B